MADEPDPVPQIRDQDDEPEEIDDIENPDVAAERLTTPAVKPRHRQAIHPPQKRRMNRMKMSPAEAPTPPEPAPPAVSRPDPARFDGALAEAVANLDLPAPADPVGDTNRVADLIAMGHTLEERDGSDHVMFNALCSEIGEALAAGIEANDPHVTAHWGSNKLAYFRHQADPQPGVQRGVPVPQRECARCGDQPDAPPPGVWPEPRPSAHQDSLGRPPGVALRAAGRRDGLGVNDALATPALDEHGSAEAAHAQSAEDAEPVVLSS